MFSKNVFSYGFLPNYPHLFVPIPNSCLGCFSVPVEQIAIRWLSPRAILWTILIDLGNIKILLDNGGPFHYSLSLTSRFVVALDFTYFLNFFLNYSNLVSFFCLTPNALASLVMIFYLILYYCNCIPSGPFSYITVILLADRKSKICF